MLTKIINAANRYIHNMRKDNRLLAAYERRRIALAATQIAKDLLLEELAELEASQIAYDAAIDEWSDESTAPIRLAASDPVFPEPNETRGRMSDEFVLDALGKKEVG
jgi:hypothetical protein